MTDEEMAEEYKADYGIDLCCLCRECEVEAISPCQHKKDAMYGYKDGFLAGLKAGRPQWHKADVPTIPINKVVLGYIKHYNSKQFCLVGWNGKWWYDAGTYNDEVKLIAWCEIPTFDKE